VVSFSIAAMDEVAMEVVMEMMDEKEDDEDSGPNDFGYGAEK
jgi:hypothetical protein